eukprot:Rhum_TRINITY_DN5773_c0_g1::Rhum_TRINITY_DN5773_c0_g1_i1::g.18307::m.18307
MRRQLLQVQVLGLLGLLCLCEDVLLRLALPQRHLVAVHLHVPAEEHRGEPPRRLRREHGVAHGAHLFRALGELQRVVHDEEAPPQRRDAQHVCERRLDSGDGLQAEAQKRLQQAEGGVALRPVLEGPRHTLQPLCEDPVVLLQNRHRSRGGDLHAPRGNVCQEVDGVADVRRRRLAHARRQRHALRALADALQYRGHHLVRQTQQLNRRPAQRRRRCRALHRSRVPQRVLHHSGGHRVAEVEEGRPHERRAEVALEHDCLEGVEEAGHDLRVLGPDALRDALQQLLPPVPKGEACQLGNEQTHHACEGPVCQRSALQEPDRGLLQLHLRLCAHSVGSLVAHIPAPLRVLPDDHDKHLAKVGVHAAVCNQAHKHAQRLGVRRSCLQMLLCALPNVGVRHEGLAGRFKHATRNIRVGHRSPGKGRINHAAGGVRDATPPPMKYRYCSFYN